MNYDELLEYHAQDFPYEDTRVIYVYMKNEINVIAKGVKDPIF